MMLAIHNAPKGFSDRWITYCEKNQVPFKLVNCYDSDIMNQLKDCDGLMWAWSQNDFEASLFVRQLTISLEKRGQKVFPDTNTSWHYDDKVGQKYLLEAINAPLVNSYVFYSKKAADRWIKNTTFPKVFKLRGGAGSINVKLAGTTQRAQSFINKAFGKGFLQVSLWNRLKDRLWVFKRDRNLKGFLFFLKGIGRIIIPPSDIKFFQRERGYVYFQDFLPDNSYDTRLIVIGNKCFGIIRYTRDNDFRASGSGKIAYDPVLFDISCIKIAFDISKKLQTQSLAYDFIFDGNTPKIVEISYSFVLGAYYDDCPGYWDNNYLWHKEKINPQYLMIEDFIENINKSK